jgi:glycerophosphoryl diester phosphodiesterase
MFNTRISRLGRVKKRIRLAWADLTMPGRVAKLISRPIAHRGLHLIENGIAENSRTAFQNAIDHSYAIELDVIISADNTPVVFHDARLDRTTDHSGAVREYDAADLMKVKFSGSEDRIETLASALQFINGRVPVFVDIKPLKNSIESTHLIAKIVTPHRATTAVMTCDFVAIDLMRKNYPRITRGIVYGKDLLGNSVLGENLNITTEQQYLSKLYSVDPHFFSCNKRDLETTIPSVKRGAIMGHRSGCASQL